jgi:hypothetical protein
MVAKQKFDRVIGSARPKTLRLRPAVVDGRLRGHDEKGEFVCKLTTVQLIGILQQFFETNLLCECPRPQGGGRENHSWSGC